MQTFVEGTLGGSLMIDAQGQVTVFFCERYVMGCPCQVRLGAALDDLLALRPGEHLHRIIAGIDDIHAGLSSAASQQDSWAVMLYFVSTYHHATNVAIISQEALCEAALSLRMPVGA
ncbi:MAG: hypothetical protein K8J31_06400 [Anaerolineae bacterium]|nr:hypothetical protein [Anaerolineae bacterium]